MDCLIWYISIWAIGYIAPLGLGYLVIPGFLERIRGWVGCDEKNWDKFDEYAHEWREENVKDKKKFNSFYKWLVEKKNDSENADKQKGEKGKHRRWFAAIQGWLEQLFVITVVAFNVPGAGAAIPTLLAVKMLTNLNRQGRDLPPELIVRRRAVTGLFGSLISVTFALLGGLICRFNNPLLGP